MDNKHTEIATISNRLTDLKKKLLDFSRRNSLVNTKLEGRTASLVRVIDVIPEKILKLINEKKIVFHSLPALNVDPLDENIKEFKDLFLELRHTDEVFLEEIEKITETSLNIDDDILKAERALKDRIREQLNMSPRQSKDSLSLAQHAQNNKINPAFELPFEEDGNEDKNHLQTLLLKDQLEKKLKTITSKSKTWEEETGINVVNIAYCFLEWGKENQEVRISPLLLQLAKIDKQKSSNGEVFYLSSTGDALETNAVLKELLKIEFGIEIKDYIEGKDPFEYCAYIQNIKPEGLIWKLHRQLVVGIFPSAKMSMYYDLEEMVNSSNYSSVISNLFFGQEEGSLNSIAEEYEVDRSDIESKVPCLALDADSSQFSTIVDIMDGKNLAVEGPPGTGKSQTIVNTIASALYAGKKVLFVAEKKAALDVVKSRLEAIGLGEFLLPIQATNTTRESFVSSIRQRLEIPFVEDAKNYPLQLIQYTKIRNEIKDYLNIISQEYGKTGLTIYQLIGKVIYQKSFHEALPQTLKTATVTDAKEYTLQEIEEILKSVTNYSAAKKQAYSTLKYWQNLDVGKINPFIIEEIQGKLYEITNLLEASQLERKHLSFLNISSDDPLEKIKTLLSLMENCSQVPYKSLELAIAIQGDKQHLDYLSELKNYIDSYNTIFSLSTTQNLDFLEKNIKELDEIALQNNFNTLDINKEKNILKSKEQTLNIQKSLINEYKNLLSDEELFDLSFSQIALAIKALNTISEDTLRLRSRIKYDELNIYHLKQILDEHNSIIEEHNRLTQLYSSINIAPNILTTYIEKLENDSFFSKLTPSYRKAKKTYLTLCNEEDFNKELAIKTFNEILLFQHKVIAFSDDSIAKDLLGNLFNGIESDFIQFEELYNFYITIEQESKNLKQLKNFLLEENTQTLLTLKQLNPLNNKQSINEAQAIIPSETEKLHVALDALERSKGLINIFSAPQEILTSSLASILKDINTLKNIRKKYEVFNLDTIEIASLQFTYGILDIFNSHKEYSFSFKGLLNENLDTIKQHITNLLQSEEEAISSLETFDKKYKTSIKKQITDYPISQYIQPLKAIMNDEDGMTIFANITYYQQELEKQNLLSLIDMFEKNNIEFNDYSKTIETIIYYSIVKDIYSKHNKILSHISTDDKNKLRKNLAKLDKKILKLNHDKLRYKLKNEAKPPYGISRGKKSELTEGALLEHETSKNKRFISARSLVQRAGRALLELKPCWMMSPLAVSQYIEQGSIHFDLCILDEASQMPPENAVGALSRATQVMIVGDTNQLPPTNFFRKMMNDENEEDEDGKVLDESILEMANACFRPKRQLAWHYRSRHSDLIQFSNNFIYDNRLIVFPSPFDDSKRLGVFIEKINGNYFKGINPKEADSIVNAVINFTKTEPDLSLGVVTLNQAQAELINEKIDQAVLESTSLANYINDWSTRNDGLEPFFVKSLENVQGDERDAIFIGTVYGPERGTGKLMHRFGPINGLAGKRRLNVLFSRSKRIIKTFTSMNADDIKPSASSNEGVKMLKEWLQYSHTGMMTSTQEGIDVFDSDFERYVKEQIEALGCEVVTQVGVSGYRIDLGIKHPSYKNGFIMGVECDGKTYHSSPSARDRDRLRQEVLEGLGWHLHRIWSTNWFKNPQAEIQRVREAILHRLDVLTKSNRDMNENQVQEQGKQTNKDKNNPNRTCNTATQLKLTETQIINKEDSPDNNKKEIQNALPDAQLEAYKFSYDSNTQEWTDKFGAIYNENKSLLKRIPLEIESFEIPPCVITIGEEAFKNCRNLQELTLASSLTTIEESAFKECISLQKITIPHSVKKIGESAFEGCKNLSSIIIFASLSSIEEKVFYECTKLQTIILPDTVTTIGDLAFYYCTSLKEIALSYSLKYIGDDAFNSCSSLENLTLPEPLNYIGERAFHNCKALRSISHPTTVDSIEDNAFTACISLKEATIDKLKNG